MLPHAVLPKRSTQACCSLRRRLLSKAPLRLSRNVSCSALSGLVFLFAARTWTSGGQAPFWEAEFRLGPCCPFILPDAGLPRRPTQAWCSLRRCRFSKAPDCRGASAAQPSRASCFCLPRGLRRLEGKPLLGRSEFGLDPVAEGKGALDQGVLLLQSTMFLDRNARGIPVTVYVSECCRLELCP